MIKQLKRYCLIILFFVPCFLQAQLITNFIPSINGQTLDGLAFAQIFNSTAEVISAKVRIKIRSISEGQVVVVQTLPMNFRPGNNNLDRVIYSKSSFNFSKTYAGNQLSQTGKFPEGEYEYCYEIIVNDAKTQSLVGTYENCFNSVIQPLTPLLLINPSDGDEICNTRPDFTWQPPMPIDINARFRLIVAEIKEKQSPVEAITYNLPVINQPNIIGNNLLYPQNLRGLVKDKKYAWQVTLYTNAKTIITKSEIWVFSIHCNEEKTSVENDSYRELKESQDGNFYVAKKFLRFSFNNPYNEGDLNYQIVNIATPGSEIKGLEKLKIKSGINKYDLDLSENRFIKNEQQYILQVTLPNGKVLSLRFIYQE